MGAAFASEESGHNFDYLPSGRMQADEPIDQWPVVQLDDESLQNEMKISFQLLQEITLVRVEIADVIRPAIQLPDGKLVAIQDFDGKHFPSFTPSAKGKTRPTLYPNSRAFSASGAMKDHYEGWSSLVIGGLE